MKSSATLHALWYNVHMIRKVIREVMAIVLLLADAAVVFALCCRYLESAIGRAVLLVALGLWILSLAFWHWVFRAWHLRRMLVRTVAVGVLLAALACAAVSLRTDGAFPEMPFKMLLGEGGWMWRVGEAELVMGDLHVVYDAYAGNVVYATKRPVDGLILISRNEITGRDYHLRRLVLYRNDILLAWPHVIDLSPLPSPTLCYGGVSLLSDKADAVEKMCVTVEDGLRRYACQMTEMYKNREMTLSVSEQLVQKHCKW